MNCGSAGCLYAVFNFVCSSPAVEFSSTDNSLSVHGAVEPDLLQNARSHFMLLTAYIFQLRWC